MDASKINSGFSQSLLRVLLPLFAIGLSMSGCTTGSSWTYVAPPPDLPEPDREMRAAWVATVANIDWPSEPGLSEHAQRGQVLRILEHAEAMGLNAIVLQVRPAADAIYPSRHEPWSVYLTGEENANPGYDPLRYWIEQAHLRGIDVHAWFNPFRAGHPTKPEPASRKHITRRHPEWTRAYGTAMWLDPGLPEAREHSLRVIMDVVNRYQIDGVHLDDYFYPYPNGDEPFPDDTSYERYLQGGGLLDRAEWRRLNINLFVRELYQRVKGTKPSVLVGISPFGIWRPGNPPGIQGFDAYERISADSRLWLREGWLDYITPQLYWNIDSVGQPFEPLLDWWASQNVEKRHLWPGLYLTRIKEQSGWAPGEIRDQVGVIRDHGGADGHVHFSMVGILENRQGVADELRASVYTTKAIPPDSAWLPGPEPTAPRVRVAPAGSTAIRVLWTPYSEGNDVRRWFVAYRTEGTWFTRILPGSTDRILLTEAGSPVEMISVRAVAPGGRMGQPRTLLRVGP